MNPDGEVAIPFNRRSLWQLFFLMLSFSVLGMLAVVSMTQEIFFNNPHAGRTSYAFMDVMYCLIVLVLWVCVNWAWFLGRCLYCHTPAFVLCQSGIVNNVSGYWVGLLRWEELEQVYSSSLAYEICLPQCMRLHRHTMPCIIVVPKKSVGRRERLLPFRLKSWLAWLDRLGEKFAAGERLLSMPMHEFMQTLNEYYVSSVRREGLP